MNAKTLLKGVDHHCESDINSLEIRDICLNSQEVREGCLFAAMKGGKCDGRKFALVAQQKGACAVLTESKIEGLSVPQIIVPDIRSAYAKVCGHYFCDPAAKLKMIGVTGTNGKSTVAYLVHKIACACGIRCGLIGTMYVHDGQRRTPATLTTPDPYLFNRILADFVKSGCKAAVSEISAHAIYWRKTDNILFDMGVFTNLTQDHLDFFGDMDSYARVKESFFTPEHIKKAVINSDDERGVKLINSVKVPVITYGLYNPADVFAVNIVQKDGCGYVVNDRDCLMEINSKLLGEFNVSNMLAAIACVRELGADCEDIAAAVNDIEPPEGRFNVHSRRTAQRACSGKETLQGRTDTRFRLRRRPRQVQASADGQDSGRTCGQNNNYGGQPAHGTQGRHSRSDIAGHKQGSGCDKRQASSRSLRMQDSARRGCGGHRGQGERGLYRVFRS